MQIIFHRPKETVVTLERAKLAAKITGTDRDDEVTDAIWAATEYVQKYLYCPIQKQTVDFVLDTWPGSVVLPIAPDSITEVTCNGVVIDAEHYTLNYRTLTIDAEGTVKVTMTAGYDSDTLPTPIKQAVLMLLTDYLRNTQAQQESALYVNQAVDNLLSLYRMRMFI